MKLVQINSSNTTLTFLIHTSFPANKVFLGNRDDWGNVKWSRQIQKFVHRTLHSKANKKIKHSRSQLLCISKKKKKKFFTMAKRKKRDKKKKNFAQIFKIVACWTSNICLLQLQRKFKISLCFLSPQHCLLRRFFSLLKFL